jgi:hypothetical protein
MRRAFSALAIAASLASIPACDSSPQSLNTEAAMYSQIVPSDSASIARWEASRYNAFRSKLDVVSLRYFRDQMTEKRHAEAKPVPIELCGALNSGVAGEQEEALRRFMGSEPELYAKARAAIYDQYRSAASLSNRSAGLKYRRRFTLVVGNGAYAEMLIQKQRHTTRFCSALARAGGQPADGSRRGRSAG